MRFPTIAAGALLVSLAVPGAAQDVLRIRITQGQVGAQPIAIAPFGWTDTTAQPPQRLGEIIVDDLRRTGRFEPKPFADLPSEPTDPAQIRWHDFRLLGTPNLVIGRLSRLPTGRFVVEMRLYDVFRAAELAVEKGDIEGKELRRRGHQLSDIIYEKLTGERGAFDTRVAYVTETRSPTGQRRYALMVADSDGHGFDAALRSSEPIMSPAWSPDGSRLAYVSFEKGRPEIYVQVLDTGAREAIASFPGLNGAPAWSPDGTRLALTLSKDGNAEIYVMYLAGRRLQRMTVSGAIDTEPAWSPDGQWLAFTSDRGGKPNIYRVPATGGEPQRLTFEGQYNARAAWSPDGTRITYVNGDGRRFRIAVQDLKTNAVHVLTDGTLDESPTFAPNGSMILYATTDAEGAALAAVSVDGGGRYRFAVDVGAVREPAWGPFRGP